MIKTIGLKNFKAFSQLESIEIAPLTIIVGKNSSGKSSILHSLLLLKQTLDSNNNETALLLEGKYLKYSSLSEIAHNLPTQASAKIEYKFELDSKKKSSIELSINNIKNNSSDSNYHPAVASLKVSIEEKIIDFKKLTLKTLRLAATANEFSFINELIKETGKKAPIVRFENFLPKLVEIRTETKGNSKRTVNIPLDLIFDDYGQQLRNLQKSIKNIRYLSPVRAMPQRAYIHYSDDTDDLYEDGRNAAHVFWGKRNEKVTWQGKEYSLIEAVNQCVNCVGLKQKLTPTQTGNIIYQIRVEIPKKSKDVTIVDVGFGYSQVLPIVLTGLLNKSDNLMLIEQPEIHLHPSSCANLADLFLGFVKDKKHFIIETHSQDFINRLRLRVIENPRLKQQINILFVDLNDDGTSRVKQFRIDENGSFPEWPSGFIDESELGARAIIKARSLSRERQSKNLSKEKTK